jgi:TPR repeat protein
MAEYKEAVRLYKTGQYDESITKIILFLETYNKYNKCDKMYYDCERKLINMLKTVSKKTIVEIVNMSNKRNSYAQNILGYMYDFGYGVNQDIQKSVNLYCQSALQDNCSGQNNLGYMYQHGEGVGQNYKKAVELYRQSILQGNSSAHNNLGQMYQYGHGVDQNYKKAVELYRQSILQGNSSAHNNLGYMYQHGEGVCQNYKKAVELYRQSVLQGSSSAQYNLDKLLCATSLQRKDNFNTINEKLKLKYSFPLTVEGWLNMDREYIQVTTYDILYDVLKFMPEVLLKIMIENL